MKARRAVSGLAAVALAGAVSGCGLSDAELCVEAASLAKERALVRFDRDDPALLSYASEINEGSRRRAAGNLAFHETLATCRAHVELDLAEH